MRALIGALAALALALPATARADASADLVAGRNQYVRGEYDGAIQTLNPLLYPRPQLRSEKDIVAAHYFLGASYFWTDKRDDARREFVSVLSLEPDYELDPATEAVDLYYFFNQVKSDLREQLEEIRRQKRLAEERKQQEIEERIRKASRKVIVERTIHQSPWWVNFVPFGVPQLQRGQKGMGMLFLSGEAVTAGLSFAVLGYTMLEYGGWPLDYPRDNATRNDINALRAVQITSGALFWLIYGGQIIHGFDSQPPAVTVKTRDEPLYTRFRLTPTAGDGGVGVGLQWEF